MGWIYLLAAGAFEVGFTTSLKMSDGLSKWGPSSAFFLFAGLSFWLLMRATETIPLGTAYAVWTGIGAVGTAVVGMAFFRDPVSSLRIVFLFSLVGSLVGLKLATVH